jgi:hypothetical protein
MCKKKNQGSKRKTRLADSMIYISADHAIIRSYNWQHNYPLREWGPPLFNFVSQRNNARHHSSPNFRVYYLLFMMIIYRVVNISPPIEEGEQSLLVFMPNCHYLGSIASLSRRPPPVRHESPHSDTTSPGFISGINITGNTIRIKLDIFCSIMASSGPYRLF